MAKIKQLIPQRKNLNMSIPNSVGRTEERYFEISYEC